MNGNWEVETSVQSRRVEAGKLTSRADAPLALSVPVDWGWYRMEVYDPATGAASSVRFQAGWRAGPVAGAAPDRSEEHTSELQSLMRISYAVFCLKKKKNNTTKPIRPYTRYNTKH